MKIFLSNQSPLLRVGAFCVGLLLGAVAPASAQDTTSQDAATVQPLNLIDQTGTSTDQPTEAEITDEATNLAADQDVQPTDGADVADDNSPADASGAATLTIGKRVVSDAGLAAIGVDERDRPKSTLDTLIWRGTPASRAGFLLTSATVMSASPALTRLSAEVVARQSVPPTGTNLIAADLVKARLAWLERAGRSRDLASIARQLPDDEVWNDWKKWLVQQQLMLVQDKDACRTVGYHATRTLDPFWHKAKVICSIFEGNLGSARFAADILQASGIDDEVFFALVAALLDRTAPPSFDPALIEPIHVVLMDAAHQEISMDALASLSSRMTESAVELRYLGAEARMVSSFEALARGVIDARRVGQLWRSIEHPADAPELALARHTSQPTALTAAMVWRALDAEKKATRLPLILAALEVDRANGHDLMLLPLYASLVRDALAFDGAAQLLSTDMTDSAGMLALLLAIDTPADAGLPTGFPTFTYARAAADLLSSLDQGGWTNNQLSTLNLWHILPILEASGTTANEEEWLDMLSSAGAAAQTQARETVSLSPPLLRAIAQAAEKRRVGETILLANWLLDDIPLASINPQDAARIILAVAAVGQVDTAKAMSGEFVRAHIMANAQSANLGDYTGSWIIPKQPDEMAVSDAPDNSSDPESAVAADEPIGDNSSQMMDADMQSEPETLADIAVTDADNGSEPDNGTTNP